MHSFPDDEIRLLILHQLQPRAQVSDLLLDGRYLLVIAHVQHAVDIEAGVRSGVALEAGDTSHQLEHDRA